MSKSKIKTKEVVIAILILFLLISVPLLLWQNYINNITPSLSQPYSETVSIKLGQSYGNRRRDACRVVLAYSGKFGDVITFAEIRVGIFKAYAYNLFVERKTFVFGDVCFQILDANENEINLLLLYPYHEFPDFINGFSPILFFVAVASFVILYFWVLRKT